MWPQTLQMSEDDCRSTLRRLELETYSNVMGVFRAQGGLSENKAKLLEELRCIFHISQDRHRAEARRVVNDEHLSTIAKVVSGPNTWQEWSREGRRSYPMLPRVAPQTALGWIANNLATEAAQENAKLPYPEETAVAAMEEQAAILTANAAAEAAGFRYSEKYVVASDPFKMPDIPAAGVKKNLKRGMNDAHRFSGASLSKKRNTNDLSSLNKHNKNLNTNAAAGAAATTNNRKAISLNRLQQQRFFYQQQQKAKKLVKAVGKREKISGPNKTGRRSKKLKEQLNQQIEQEEQLLRQQQLDLSERSYENQYMQQQLGHIDPSTKNIGIMSSENLQQHIDGFNDQKEIQSIQNQQQQQQQKSFYLPLMVPQIAASKRDITRNLTKLQIPGQVASSSSRMSTAQLEAGPMQNQALNSPTVSSQIVLSSKAVVDGKLAPLSTPVQKYIVEDRQPPHSSNVAPSVSSSSSLSAASAATASALSSSSSPSICPSAQQASTSPYMALSHLSTPNKLRTLNTTILPPGTKLSTSAKKLSGATILSATVVSPGNTPNSQLTEVNSQNQVYFDGGGANLSAGPSSSSSQQILTASSGPTHTPPAVIQLHSNEVVRVGSQQTTGATSTQSKVLTTKILPLVLSSKGDSTKNGSANTAAAAAVASTPNFATNSGTACSTIIKSLSPSMFVSSQHSGFSSSSPVFSSFGSTGSVYRKHPNILKSSSSILSRNSSASSGGPQIISNIRLTPAISTVTTTNSSFTMHQTQSGIFQQPLRTQTGSSGIRTSVKICQSPNGKVFIQPANVDTSKLTKLTSGHISQRILPGTLLGTSANLGGTNATGGSSSGSSLSSSSSTNQPGSPHRIAIQKVQIIPAPLSGNTLGSSTQTQNQSLQQQQHRLGTASLTKGSFSGNIFVPTGTGLRSTKASGAITLTKATFSNTITGSQSDLLSNSNVGSLVTKQHSDMVSKTSNVVVIDATSGTSKMIPHHTKLTNLSSSSSIARSNLDSSQMITEDTPVDIIVDNSPNMADDASPVTETSSITAVLASNVLDNAQKQKSSAVASSSPTIVPITVLNATDWEMELDQATAASLTQAQQGGGSNMTSFGVDSANGTFKQKMQKHTHIEQTEIAETIIIDDSFEDVIIEEEEHEERITDNEHYEEQGPQDMDIEVSDDHEIIMMDNFANLEEGKSLNSPKSNDELLEGDLKSNMKKSNMLDEIAFKSISSSIEHKIESSIDVSPIEANEKNDENTKETNDLVNDLESTFVPDPQSPIEPLTTKSEDLLCNNHEESAPVMQALKMKDHVSADDVRIESELNSNTELSTETSKTKISASLFSVKEIQDPVENNSEVESDNSATSTTNAFDVRKEKNFNKNDVVHAFDQ